MNWKPSDIAIVKSIAASSGSGGGEGVVPNIQATAETISAGSEATVTRTGSNTNPVFHFGIPEGDPGPAGEAGAAATINGKNAITLAAGQNVSIDTAEDGTVTISSSAVSGGGEGGSGLITWDDIIGRPDVSSLADLISISIKLMAANWSENQLSYSAMEIKADESSQLIVPVPISADWNICEDCNVRATEQKEGVLVFKCDKVPSSDISLTLFILTPKTVKVGINPDDFEWWNPKMTSNTAPAPYVASTSSAYNANYQAFMAFNTTSNYWYSAIVGIINISNVWIQLDFGDKTFVSGIRICSNSAYANQFPKSFTVYGSDDNLNFKPLVEWKLPDSEHQYGPSQNVYFEALFSDLAGYRYYRLTDFICLDSQSTAVQIGSIEFFKYKGEV